MLPLPIFDGDRMVKEFVNWGVGEKYDTKRKKKDRFLYKKQENFYGLSEYRVEKVDSIKIFTKESLNGEERSESILGEKNYKLIDKIGDGYTSTIQFDLPEQRELPENSIVEVSYEHWYDEKKRQKRIILNVIRLVTLFIILGNFILSFIHLGTVAFWLS